MFDLYSFSNTLVVPFQELNSPWDVSVGPDGSTLFIAMAGQHQIWKADLESGIFEVFSGTGYERNQNGSKYKTAYFSFSFLFSNPMATNVLGHKFIF